VVRVQEADPAKPRYLDETALETPSLALADAARETLRMGVLAVESAPRNGMRMPLGREHDTQAANAQIMHGLERRVHALKTVAAGHLKAPRATASSIALRRASS